MLTDIQVIGFLRATSVLHLNNIADMSLANVLFQCFQAGWGCRQWPLTKLHYLRCNHCFQRLQKSSSSMLSSTPCCARFSTRMTYVPMSASGAPILSVSPMRRTVCSMWGLLQTLSAALDIKFSVFQFMSLSL